MEVKLSNRMQEVSSLVRTKNIADIGCDHAFVSIFLVQSGKADKVLAMDVKDGPLDIAKENIASFGLSEYIDVRKSNGFAAANVGEIDSAIIAGMGGHLIVNILEAGKAFTDSGIELILQPQSDIPFVREYLQSIGYTIDCEKMLIEEEKYYTIIRAVKSDCHMNLSREELDYGPVLLAEKNETLLGFMKHTLNKNAEIISKLKCNETESSSSRVEQLEEDNRFIEEVISKYY